MIFNYFLLGNYSIKHWDSKYPMHNFIRDTIWDACLKLLNLLHGKYGSDCKFDRDNVPFQSEISIQQGMTADCGLYTLVNADRCGRKNHDRILDFKVQVEMLRDTIVEIITKHHKGSLLLDDAAYNNNASAGISEALEPTADCPGGYICGEGILSDSAERTCPALDLLAGVSMDQAQYYCVKCTRNHVLPFEYICSDCRAIEMDERLNEDEQHETQSDVSYVEEEQVDPEIDSADAVEEPVDQSETVDQSEPVDQSDPSFHSSSTIYSFSLHLFLFNLIFVEEPPKPKALTQKQLWIDMALSLGIDFPGAIESITYRTCVGDELTGETSGHK